MMCRRLVVLLAILASGCGSGVPHDAGHAGEGSGASHSSALQAIREQHKRMVGLFGEHNWMVVPISQTMLFPMVAVSSDGWIVMPRAQSGYLLGNGRLDCDRGDLSFSGMWDARSDGDTPAPAPVRVPVITSEVAQAACSSKPSAHGDPRVAVLAARAAFAKDHPLRRPSRG